MKSVYETTGSLYRGFFKIPAPRPSSVAKVVERVRKQGGMAGIQALAMAARAVILTHDEHQPDPTPETKRRRINGPRPRKGVRKQR